MVLVSVMAIGLSSCLKDDLEDLQSQVAELEKNLGFDQPLSAQFDTKNDAGTAVSYTKKFLYQSPEYIYMEDNGDNTFDIYVEKYSDPEWYEGAWVFFTYDASTGEVVGDPRGGIYFNDENWRWVNPWFSRSNYGDSNTCTVTINSINTSTGKIDFVFDGSTTDAATNNEYSGKAMTLKLTFKGTLPKYND